MVALSCGCAINVNSNAADGVVETVSHDPTTGLLTLTRSIGGDVTGVIQTLDPLQVNAGIEGSTLTRVGTGNSLTNTDFQMLQRHYTLSSQVMTVNHTTPGDLTFTVTAQTKAVKVNASADITGLNVSGMQLSGVEWSQIHGLLVATADINVAMTDTNVIVVTGEPTTMLNGDQERFEIQRWNF